MELKKAKMVFDAYQKLEQKREDLESLDSVKEFTKIKIEGEDGDECSNTLFFDKGYATDALISIRHSLIEEIHDLEADILRIDY